MHPEPPVGVPCRLRVLETLRIGKPSSPVRPTARRFRLDPALRGDPELRREIRDEPALRGEVPELAPLAASLGLTYGPRVEPEQPGIGRHEVVIGPRRDELEEDRPCLPPEPSRGGNPALPGRERPRTSAPTRQLPATPAHAPLGLRILDFTPSNRGGNGRRDRRRTFSPPGPPVRHEGGGHARDVAISGPLRGCAEIGPGVAVAHGAGRPPAPTTRNCRRRNEATIERTSAWCRSRAGRSIASHHHAETATR